jgi:hypothetical protein
MLNVNNLPEGHKRHRSGIDLGYDVTTYLDTIEIFFPLLRSEQYRDVNRFGEIKECRDHQGSLWGYRLILNQPNRRTVLRLDPIVKRYRGTVCRFDLAMDIQVPDAKNAKKVKDMILRTALLRWRRRGPMHDKGDGPYYDRGTFYWVWWEKRHRSNRSLILYADKDNRFTGELGCVHLELKFLKANVVRSQGIHRVKDLLDVNPKALFDKHVKWTDYADKYVQKVVRQAVKKDRAQYQGKRTHPANDRVRGSLHKIMEGILHRAKVDRAQTWKDRGRDMKAIKCPFTVPTTLTWQK